MMKSDNSADTKGPSFKATSPPPFSGTILEQVLQFVLPEDIARASMVCKTWRDHLKPAPKEGDAAVTPGVVINSKAIWKQAVTNSCPNLIQAVLQASSGQENAAPQMIDFHSLAKRGLGRKRKKPELPQPTFRIEDLLIVVEIQKLEFNVDEYGEEDVSIEPLGAFFHEGSEAMLNGEQGRCGKITFDLNTGPGLVLEGKNPLCPETYNGNIRLYEEAKTKFHTRLSEAASRHQSWYHVKSPIESAGGEAMCKLMVSVTLFRRDDWRFFRLTDDVYPYYDYEQDSDSPVEHSFRWDTYEAWGHPWHSPFARNEVGSVAHEVVESTLEGPMYVSLDIEYGCILPPPGSPDEPAWRQKLRLPPTTAAIEWNEQDDDEISRVSTFQFRLDSLSMDMGSCGEYAESYINDSNEFLLLLEGLDWE